MYIALYLTISLFLNVPSQIYILIIHKKEAAQRSGRKVKSIQQEITIHTFLVPSHGMTIQVSSGQWSETRVCQFQSEVGRNINIFPLIFFPVNQLHGRTCVEQGHMEESGSLTDQIINIGLEQEAMCDHCTLQKRYNCVLHYFDILANKINSQILSPEQKLSPVFRGSIQ